MNTFYKAFDTERMNPERGGGDHRTPFQIDRDRVLYTSTFRQLQSKTQVFLSGEYDFYRTRLTHSLEVAQIGRSISFWLKSSSDLLAEDFFIDSDLVEAACLSHDLGHPPFGHAGEQVLNELMREWGGFEGNAQTLRLLTQRIFAEKRQGMNPSRAFMDSVLKYKSLWAECGGRESPPKNHFIYNDQSEYLDWVLGGNDFPIEYVPGVKRDSFKSIECQIMDWADDTAYSLNDLADGVRAGFLTSQRIETWAEEHDCSPVESSAINALLRSMKEKRLDGFVGRRIGQYIRATRLVDDVNFLSSYTNRYRYCLEVEPEVQEACSLYKKLSFELVFLQTGLKQLEFKGRKMLQGLWQAFQENCFSNQGNHYILPLAIREELQASEPSLQHRLLVDYLASLSDLSAKKLYLRLFDPEAGSITDLASF